MFQYDPQPIDVFMSKPSVKVFVRLLYRTSSAVCRKRFSRSAYLASCKRILTGRDQSSKYRFCDKHFVRSSDVAIHERCSLLIDHMNTRCAENGLRSINVFQSLFKRQTTELIKNSNRFACRFCR